MTQKLKDVDVLTEKDLSVDSEGAGEAPAPEEGREGLWPVERLRPVLEAVLFASGDPLPIKRMCEVLDGPTRKEVYDALKAIKVEFLTRGLRVVEVAGGWQFRTAPEHHAVVKRLFKERPQRLTRAAVETAAIVAYRQPCTRQEVESIRGVDCGGVLETLVERKLLKIAGRRDVPGRPLVYATSREFLELFGLKDLKSLPTLSELDDDIQSLAQAAEFDAGSERDAAIIPVEEGDGEEATPQEEAGGRVFGAQTAHDEDPAQAGGAETELTGRDGPASHEGDQAGRRDR